MADRRTILDRHPAGPAHVQSDILERLMEHDRLHLEALLDEAVAAYPPGAEARLVAGKLFLTKAWGYMQTVHLNMNSKCFKCGGECPCYPSVEELGGRELMVVMGNTCISWSAMGAGAGWVHESTIPMLVVCKSIVDHLPKRVVQECVVGFDWETFAWMMQPYYVVQKVQANPRLQGYPCTRRRSYCVLKRRNDARGIKWSQANYQRIAGSKVVADASIYFCAPDQMLQKQRKAMAKMNSLPWQIDGVAIPWFSLISRSKQRRLLEHLRVLSLKQKKTCGFYVANLMQTPYFRKPGPLLEALLQESVLFGWHSSQELTHESAREFLAAEHFVAMGMPVFHPSAPGWNHLPSVLKSVAAISKEKPCKLRSMTGNGMHVAQVGAAVLVALQ